MILCDSVKAGQEQGVGRTFWGKDAFFCLPSRLCEDGLEQVWLVPALNVSLDPSFSALWSRCARPALSLGLCSLPGVGFRWLPLAGGLVCRRSVKSRLAPTRFLSVSLLEVELTPVLGGVPEILLSLISGK